MENRIKGVKRVMQNRFDYVSVVNVDTASGIVTICAREGGGDGGYADLDFAAVRQLITLLEASIAKAGA